MVLAFTVMQKPEVGVVSAVYSIVMYVNMFLIAAGRRMVARNAATQGVHGDTVGGERSRAYGSTKTDVVVG